MRSFEPDELDRIIEMAWEDRTTFEAIEYQFGITEPEVIELMRQSMKASSFRMWRISSVTYLEVKIFQLKPYLMKLLQPAS